MAQFSNTSPAGNALKNKLNLTNGGLSPLNTFRTPGNSNTSTATGFTPNYSGNPIGRQSNVPISTGGGMITSPPLAAASNKSKQTSSKTAGYYGTAQPYQPVANINTQNATPLYNTSTGLPISNNASTDIDPKTGFPVNKAFVENMNVNAQQANNTPTTAYNSTTPTVGGVAGGLASTQTSPYNQQVSTSVTGLNNAPGQNQVYADRAQAIANAAGQRISDIGGQGARGEAGYLTTGTSPVAEGNAAITAQTTAAQQQAVAQGANMQLAGNAQGLTAQQQAQAGLQAGGGLANTGQGNVQNALYNAGGLVAPQPYGLTTQPYFPGSDTYGGGGSGGAINRAIQAQNIGSAQDFTKQIQDIDKQKGAADSNFSILGSYAQGFAGNSPIINSIKQKWGSTVQGNNAVAGFQATLQQIRQQWSDIVGGDATQAIPDNITPDQLKQIQQSLSSGIQNKRAGIQGQLDKLTSGTSNTQAPSEGSSTFGGAAWK